MVIEMKENEFEEWLSSACQTMARVGVTVGCSPANRGNGTYLHILFENEHINVGSVKIVCDANRGGLEVESEHKHKSGR